MDMFNKIMKNNVVLAVMIFVSIIFIGNSIVPYFTAYNEQLKVKTEKEEAQTELDYLNSMSGITEEGEMQRQYAREQYNISKDDELLFVFPDEE